MRLSPEELQHIQLKFKPYARMSKEAEGKPAKYEFVVEVELPNSDMEAFFERHSDWLVDTFMGFLSQAVRTAIIEETPEAVGIW